MDRDRKNTLLGIQEAEDGEIVGDVGEGERKPREWRIHLFGWQIRTRILCRGRGEELLGLLQVSKLGHMRKEERERKREVGC